MQTQETQQARSPQFEPPSRQRRGLAAAGVAFIVVLIAGIGVWLVLADGGGSDVVDVPPPVTTANGLPDFSTEPALAAAALTAAYNSHDIDTYLSVFADDAQLTIYMDLVSLEELRSEGMGWEKAMNQRIEYSDCVVNGSRMSCTWTTTSDWLAPTLAPIEGEASLTVADGKITQMRYAEATTSLSSNPSYQLRSDFRQWTFENHQENFAQMWQNRDAWPLPVFTEESAELHLTLGEEYLLGPSAQATSVTNAGLPSSWAVGSVAGRFSEYTQLDEGFVVDSPIRLTSDQLSAEGTASQVMELAQGGTAECNGATYDEDFLWYATSTGTGILDFGDAGSVAIEFDGVGVAANDATSWPRVCAEWSGTYAGASGSLAAVTGTFTAVFPTESAGQPYVWTFDS